MPLATQIATLATRIATEIKAVRSELASGLAGKAATSHTHTAALDTQSGGGARTVDCTVASTHAIFATSNVTSLTVSGTPTDGQRLVVEVIASGGTRTVTHALARMTGLDTVLTIANGQVGLLGLYYSARAGHWILSSFNEEA